MFALFDFRGPGGHRSVYYETASHLSFWEENPKYPVPGVTMPKYILIWHNPMEIELSCRKHLVKAFVRALHEARSKFIGSEKEFRFYAYDLACACWQVRFYQCVFGFSPEITWNGWSPYDLGGLL